MTRGRLADVPGKGEERSWWQRLAWSSATFATTADIAMGMYGGDLKRKEAVTGRLADILFSQPFHVERIAALEDRLKYSLQSCRGDIRMRQPMHDLPQLGNGGDAHFIPVEERLLDTSKRLIGVFVVSILQTASVNQMFQNGTVSGRDKGRVVFFEDFVDF